MKVIRLNDLMRRSQFVIVFIPKLDFLDNLSVFSCKQYCSTICQPIVLFSSFALNHSVSVCLESLLCSSVYFFNFTVRTKSTYSQMFQYFCLCVISISQPVNYVCTLKSDCHTHTLMHWCTHTYIRSISNHTHTRVCVQHHYVVQSIYGSTYVRTYMCVHWHAHINPCMFVFVRCYSFQG